MSDKNYAIFLVISEIVITTIAFVGAYFILKPVFVKNKKPKDEKGAEDEEIKGKSTENNE